MSRAQNLNSWDSIYDGYKFTMATAANESSPTLQIPEKIDEYHEIDDWHQYCPFFNEICTACLDVKRHYYSTIIHGDIKPANILLDGKMVYTDEYHGFDDVHQYFQTLNEICYRDGKRDSTIIHRDIKPANILLNGNMVPKISDFGISKLLMGEERTRTKESYIGTQYKFTMTTAKKESSPTCQIPEKIDEYHGINWHPRYQISKGICAHLAHFDDAWNDHGDLKPDNILLDDMWEIHEDFKPNTIVIDDIWKLSVEDEQTRTMESSIGTQGYMPPEYRDSNLNRFDIFTLGVIIMKILTGPTGYSNNSEMSSKYFTQIMKTIIEIGLTFVGIIEYVMIIPFAHDILVLLNSGASLSAAVDVDRINLLLDSNGKALAAIPSMHPLFFWSNLADERSDKPRSNRAPATNSSQETTHAPMANKLIDDEAENHSDPNSCVIERDTNEKEKRSAEWYIATGAAHHATWKRDLFSNLVDVENDGRCVHAADGTPMPVCGRGDVVTDDVVLPDVYYVPGLCTNLVSVGQLAGLDYCVGFGRGACVISNAAGAVVGRAHARGDGLYEVDFLTVRLSVA